MSRNLSRYGRGEHDIFGKGGVVFCHNGEPDVGYTGSAIDDTLGECVKRDLAHLFGRSLGITFRRESVEGEDGGGVCDEVVDEFRVSIFGERWEAF